MNHPFAIDARPGRHTYLFLSSLLFLLLVVAYNVGSHIRLQDNPRDKIMPSLGQMADGIKRVALPMQPPEGKDELTPKQQKDQYRLWKDTWATGKRFLISVALLFVAALLGVNMGVFPYVDAFFNRFMTFLNSLVAMSLLAIIMVIFGTGDTSKVMLVQFGIFPFIVLDAYLRARSVPREQIVKGQTLAASNFEIAYRIVMPQIMPRILDSIRLSLKSVMVYLIAAEAIAAKAGLGYRTFVLQRYIAMDIIIPYVIWIALLMFLADHAFKLFIRRTYPWAGSS